MANFHVGQKVVCVNDEPHVFTPLGIPHNGNLEGLTKGKIYTIRGFDVGFSNLPCLYLEEIVRKSLRADFKRRENSFAAARFRPVKKVKTDISIFTSMLVPTPAPLNPVEVA